MSEEMDRLGQNVRLAVLLGHYAEGAKLDREAWQDRVSEMEGLAARDLTRLHGELIASGWIEQNTGETPTAMPAGVAAPACYRATSAGLRALRQIRQAV